ncbi:hypothetical protein [Streptomyces xanthochromogenes]|uniref:hypothetical protein n=1 Tax=Streptomyces xanthochromogenes TaxID=67384 RepID=UPI003F4DCEAB
MTTADFRPTHVVPQDGLPAWEAPDVNRPTTPLDALLPVQLVDRLGDWGRIVCANGWSAWVDGRLLVAVPQDPPGAGGPLTRTADPRPLLARTEEALAGYRRAAEELAGGGADGESFRRRTRGLRVGVVVDGESVWLYDAEHERWVYCDGARLSTYAAGERPSTYAAGEGPSVDGHGGGNGTAPVVADGAVAGAGTRPGAGEDVGGGAEPQATQAVESGAPSPDDELPAVVPAVPSGPDGVEGGTGPGETRVVEAAGSGTGRPPVGDAPDRHVPGAGEGPEPEPTQVVAAVADPGVAPAPHGQRPTTLLPPEAADPDPPIRPGED